MLCMKSWRTIRLEIYGASLVWPRPVFPLYSPRQLTALTTFSDLIRAIREKLTRMPKQLVCLVTTQPPMPRQ